MSPISRELRLLENPRKAKVLAGFFKTGKGHYAEGDVFLGVTVPGTRAVVRKFAAGATMADVSLLLGSRFHEERLAALLLLVEKYRQSPKASVDFYLSNTKLVNNWDLVDLSAHQILGDFLLSQSDRSILARLAKSGSLWERRISIVATYAFIRIDSFAETFRIARILLNDRHDLIHKAVGWMLREVGKRNQPAEERFLRQHCKEMPRTMLRYAVERFDFSKRALYLRK